MWIHYAEDFSGTEKIIIEFLSDLRHCTLLEIPLRSLMR